MKSKCLFTDGVSRGRVLSIAVADAVGVAVALFAAVFLRLGWEEGAGYLQSHGVALLASWGVFMLMLGISGMYESDLLHRLGRTLAAAFVSVAIGTLLVIALFYATLSLHIGRGVFLRFAVLVLVTTITIRFVYRAVYSLACMSQRTLVVGTNGEVRNVIDLVQQHPHSGIHIVGLVHVGKDWGLVGKSIHGHPILGTDESLDLLIKKHQVERLILAAPAELEPLLQRRLRSFRYRGVALVDYVSLHEELTGEISLEHIDEEWLFTAAMNNSRFHIRYLKRLTDIGISLFGIVVSAPLMAVAAVLIKLSSSGTVLYRQERLGLDCTPFTIFKFRTMYADAESRTGPVWATEDDPRITPVGKWLRKFRIDELPQLFNVLRGEMSVVGPRPERTVFVNQLSMQVPFYAERLLVKPGITGWAQVNLPYAASIEESRHKLQADLYYIKNLSFLMDLYILSKTVKIVFFGRERAKQRAALAATVKVQAPQQACFSFPTSDTASPQKAPGEVPPPVREPASTVSQYLQPTSAS